MNKSKVSIILGAVLKKVISVTSPKFSVTPISRIKDPELKSKEIGTIRFLRSRYKGKISIIEGALFNNACYIPGMKTLLESIKDENERQEGFEYIARHLGISLETFLKNLSDDMIVVGRNFDAAAIWSHEFGHFVSTRRLDLSTDSDFKAHEKYGQERKSKVAIKSIGNLLAMVVGVSMIFSKYYSLALPFEMIFKGVTNIIVGFNSRNVLKAEAAASRIGIDLMTMSGQWTPSEIEVHRRLLKEAYNTYLLNGRILPLTKGLASLAVGGLGTYYILRRKSLK